MDILELKYLAPYLPYGLKLSRLNKENKPRIIEMNNGNIMLPIEKPDRCKPILIPLDELNVSHPVMLELCDTHTVEYNGRNTFVDLDSECNNDPYDVKYLPYDAFMVLVKHRFDVFGLIEKGLAIDINTLNGKEETPTL